MNDKHLVALKAAEMIEDGMLVGLGTGSTADYFIQELANRTHKKGLKITVAASSVVSMIKAKEFGLSLLALENLTRLDYYVDGADEVDSDNTLLKGQGADLVKEKLMASNSDQFIVLVDKSKMVDYIGQHFAIPVEVMPFAWQLVVEQLQNKGAQCELRQNRNGSGLAVSSYGSLILDVSFDSRPSASELDSLLNNMPGVVEHGIFRQLASVVLVADHGEVRKIIK